MDPDPTDAATRAMVDLNVKIGRDERVSATLLAIGDGLTLVRKK